MSEVVISHPLCCCNVDLALRLLTAHATIDVSGTSACAASPQPNVNAEQGGAIRDFFSRTDEFGLALSDSHAAEIVATICVKAKTCTLR